MMIASLILLVVIGLVVCETCIGQPTMKDSGCAMSRISAFEAATRATPLLLAGLGLPLAIAHPLPGLSCLALAGALFAFGLRRFPGHGQNAPTAARRE